MEQQEIIIAMDAGRILSVRNPSKLKLTIRDYTILDSDEPERIKTNDSGYKYYEVKY